MPEESGEPRFEEEGNPILERRDEMMERASDLQKKAAEIQGAKYQTALLTIMERSGDNPEIINALNKFLDGLDRRSHRGASDGPLLSPDYLAESLNEAAENLNKK